MPEQAGIDVKEWSPGEVTPWNPRRREVREWFDRNAPALGELYQASVILLYQHPIPGHLRLVCHAMREIGNRLPDVVAEEVRGRVDYVGRMDDLNDAWRKCGPERLTDGSWQVLPDARNCVPVDIRLVRRVSKLIDDHVDGREKPAEKAYRLFRAAADGGGNHSGLGPVVDQWVSLTKWAVSKTHVPSGPTPKAIDPDELREKFELFEDALGALLGTFYQTVEELDAILESANT